MMHPKRTMTMNWDGLGDDEDDFFDSNNRISAVVPIDFIDGFSSGSSDDEFEDPRMSFIDPRMSCSEGPPRLSNVGGGIPAGAVAAAAIENYDLWMAAPTSINERRRRLLQGMGLNSSKELMRLRTLAMSTKYRNVSMKPRRSSVAPPLPPSSQPKTTSVSSSVSSPKKKDEQRTDIEAPEHKDEEQYPDSPSNDIDPFLLVRSRSDGDMHPFSVYTKRRKEEMIGKVSKQRLTRTLSTLAPFARLCKFNYTVDAEGDKGNRSDTNKRQKRSKNSDRRSRKAASSHNQSTGGQLGAFFLIKNLDTGKEFIVKEFAEDGMWNRLSDLQTGKQLTMEEFEKSVGHSRLVKELMRREKVRRGDGSGALERKTSVNAILSKSFRYSKRKSQSLIKNMSKVAHSVKGSGPNSDNEKENHPTPIEQPPQKGGKSSGNSNSNNNSINNSNNVEWVRVRAQGKHQKELTALKFCQEIQAHQGSIWTLKFNFDGRYLASAGEDKMIHVWEVQECEIASLRPPEEGGSTPVHPMVCPSPDQADRPPLAPDLSTLEKKKKGKSASRRGSSMPDYVQLPATVFELSNEPICSFEGHLDDVLDLSWSTSQLLLLSSSMDKTVRLWDLKKKACLKLFAHNDYVTCIQFNPVSDDYFISGSLDAKVRIWSVSERRVVDWTDLHEMVTATCYTPDGQGAAIGSHKGNCRMYSITDGKLNQTSQFDIPTKKKTIPKKITGFEFNAERPSEVLVTSADSRVRIYDGTDVIQKFRGFRNTNSQIAASFSSDGKYVISASEDSNVYIWKRQEQRNGKTKTTIETNSHEHFQCKDVSVAIPWPRSVKSSTTQLNNRNNKQPSGSTMGSPMKDEANKNKKQLPPLPNNKKTGEKADSNTCSNDNTDIENNGGSEQDTDPTKMTRSECGDGEGGSIRGGDSPSRSSNPIASPSRSPSRSMAGGSGGDATQLQAWGLVIVTAGLGGEIRTYQNFGLPLKVGSNLF